MIQTAAQKDFNRRTVRSFKKAKAELESVKESTHEWITFLHKNQQLMAQKIQELEVELAKFKAMKVKA